MYMAGEVDIVGVTGGVTVLMIVGLFIFVASVDGSVAVLPTGLVFIDPLIG